MLNYMLLMAFLLSAVLSADAVNPRKNLEIRIASEGTVVFVRPAKMSRTERSLALKDLDYDISLNTSVDTVIINCSVITAGTMPLDSVTISEIGSYSAEKLYKEPTGGGKWLNRLSVSVPSSDFMSMVESDTAPHIDFRGAAFQLSDKKWKEYRQTLALALEIINQNKKE